MCSHNCGGDSGDTTHEVLQGGMWKEKGRGHSGHLSLTCPFDLLTVGDLHIGTSCSTRGPGKLGKVKVGLYLGTRKYFTPDAVLTCDTKSPDLSPTLCQRKDCTHS